MDVTYQYVKKRLDCGHQTLFCEHGPDMCDTITANRDEQKNYILRNPVHELIQHSPDFSEHHINTFRAEYETTGTNHMEGGWPKDVHPHDPESVQRYRRKIEKEDSYIHCVMNATPGLEHLVLQNNAVDMYQSYYVKMPAMPKIETVNCRTINVYRDRAKRPVSKISWQKKGGTFSACYVDMDFYRIPNNITTAYIWNVEYAISPEHELQPKAPLLDLQFNPRDQYHLVGGITTGQVVEFDYRTGPDQVNSCPPHVAHRDLVRQVMFINSKSGKEYFSSGPDGVVKWWDSRNLSEPTDEMIIDLVNSANDVPSMATAYGVSVLEYESTFPTRFMVGTENGLMIGGNRKGKTPMEQLPAKFEAHLGPVVSVERNPAFPRIFLTVGAWTAKIWTEECRESPILWTPGQRHRINSGGWSPTRFSLLALCHADGRLSFWDVLRRSYEPVFTVQLCHEDLTTLSYHDEGHLIAVGSRRGDVILEDLSEHLVYPDQKDKAALLSVFERVSKLEHILEARLREMRLKIRQAEEGSTASGADEEVDIDLSDVTAEYWSIVKKEMANMHGL